MSGAPFFFWIAVPYLALATFVVGHAWRWRRDQFGWTSRSSQLMERRLLRWGGPLFHYGAAAAIAGHILGLLVPAGWTAALGISEPMYHALSAGAGTAAGLAVVAGLAILLYRRIRVPRVAIGTTRVDIAIYALLSLTIGLGILETVGINLLAGGYDYRATVAVWFRGLFLLSPQPELMVSAPTVYQLHALSAWLLFALWPFSRLVHAWSYPILYLGRPWILYRGYRKRAPVPAASLGGSTQLSRRASR